MADADKTVKIGVTPDFTGANWDEVIDKFKQVGDQADKAKMRVAQLGTEVLHAAQAMGTSGGRTPTNPAEVGKLLQSRLSSLGRSADINDPAATTHAPAPIRNTHQAYLDWKAAEDEARQSEADRRATRKAMQDYGRTVAGALTRQDTARRHQFVFGAAARMRERERLGEDPEAQADFADRVRHQTVTSEMYAMARKIHRPQARREAAEKLGIELPPDLSPFAKHLQQTFKTATSLGMMEALAGGSATPLARALAENVIAGAILPAAMNGIGKIFSGGGGGGGGGGGFQVNPGGLLDRMGIGKTSKTATADADKIAADASSVESNVPGASMIGKIPGGGAVLGVLALGVGATIGAGLYASAKAAGKNTVEENLWAGSSGRGFDGNNMIRSMIGSSSRYMYHPDDVAQLMTNMSNAGVSGNQLRGNTDNALMLARLTGSDPAKMGDFVAKLALQPGGSSDNITKLIELMSIQNNLTKDQLVPLTSIMSSVDALQTATGGLPTGAGQVAGLAAIGHVLASAGAAGRTPGLPGQMMSGVMGAYGGSALMMAGVLGINPAELAREQASGDPTPLFKRMAGFLQKNTRDIKDPQTRLDFTEQAMGTLFNISGSKAQMDTMAKALLDPKTIPSVDSLRTMFGKAPLDVNKFKEQVSKGAGQTVSSGEQAIIAKEDQVWHATLLASDHLQTIIDLMNGKKPASVNPVGNAITGIGKGNALGVMGNEFGRELGILGGDGGLALSQTVSGLNSLGSGLGNVGNIIGSHLPTFGFGGGGPGTPLQGVTPGSLVYGSLLYSQMMGGTRGTGGGSVTIPSSTSTSGDSTNVTGVGGGGWRPGLYVPKFNNSGTNETVPLTKDMYNRAVTAHKLTGIPLSILLAQAAHETGLSGGGAGGIAQFTDPGAIAAVNSSARWKRLGLGNFDPTNVNQALIGEGIYDQINRVPGGSWRSMLSNYNAGMGADARGRALGNLYADKTLQAAAQLEKELVVTGTLTVKDSHGHAMGTAAISGGARRKIGAH